MSEKADVVIIVMDGISYEVNRANLREHLDLTASTVFETDRNDGVYDD